MAVGFAPAGVVFVAKGVDQFLRNIAGVNRTLDRLNKNTESTTNRLNQFETQATAVGNIALAGLAAGILAVVVALGSLTLAGISTAASFENAFADVTKTVETFVDRAATAETGVIQLTEAGAEFRQSLMDLSEVIPVTFERLSEIAGLGGQLGIVEGLAGDEAQEALLSFTETVAGLAEATNLTQAKAATGLAQISNIYRTSVKDIGENIERLGATIVELGNTSATTESLILNFTQRIAGAGQVIGLTQAEVLGIGTAFASIGITAEAGSTAVNRALLIMNEAVSNSTDVFADNTGAISNVQDQISDLNADLVRLEAQTGITGQSLVDQQQAFLDTGGAVEDFGRQLGDARREQLFQTQTAISQLTQQLDVLRLSQGRAITTEVFDELLRVVQQTERGMNLTADAFKDLFQEKPAEAFALFVEGLAEEGDRAGETLDRIGLGSVEATRAFLAIAGASDTVRDRIMAATEAFEENSALVDEVSIRYATLRSRFKTFQNTLRNLAVDIFGSLIPVTIGLVDEAKEVVQVFGDSLPEVFEALSNKFMPELQEVFDSFDFSNFDLSDTVQTSLDNLIETIDSMDVSNLSDIAIEIRDTIVPIYTGAIDLATEHSDILIGAVKGLIAILGGTALFAAFGKVAAAIGFLATPLGTVSLSVIGLAIAWETNFLKIQQVTESVTKAIGESWDKLIAKFQDLDLGFLSETLEGPTVDLTDISFDEAIPLDLEPTFFSRLETAATSAFEAVGKLIGLVVDTPIDQVIALMDVFQGLLDVFEGLNSDSLNLAITLDGLQTIISGIVDTLTAPIINLAELFGFELDFTSLKDSIFEGLKDFTVGFLSVFTGMEIEDLGDSFTELLESIIELGQSAGIQAFLAGLVQIGEGLGDLFEALGELSSALKTILGFQPDDSLLLFLGQLVGLMAQIGVDQIINLVEGLTGLVTVLTGLLNLDFETVGSGLETLGLAFVGFIVDPIQRISEFAGFDFKTEMEALALIGIASFQTTWDQGFVSMDLGISISTWITNLNQDMVRGINTLITNIQTLFATNLSLEDLRIELGLPTFDELDQQVTAWLDEISRQFALATLGLALDLLVNIPTAEEIDLWVNELSTKIDETTSEGLIELGLPTFEEIDTWLEGIFDRIRQLGTVWDEVDIGVPDFTAFALILAGIPQNMIDTIEGVWAGVDLGVPSFQTLLDKAKEIADKVKGFFVDLFDVDFDFGILQKLADLGIIDLDLDTSAIEDAKVEAEDLGTDLAEGLIQNVEDAEQSWQDAWLEFLTAPIEAGKEALGIESPSTLTEAMARDVVAGYAVGLSDFTPIEQALMGMDSLILLAFQNLSTELTQRTIPTVQQADTVFTTFYSNTLPKVTAALRDELIPAKIELMEVNVNELIPSVEDLILVEETLGDTFDDVWSKLDRLISFKEKDISRSKVLTTEIDKLTEAYLALAEAMGKASDVGSGVPSVPSTTPAATGQPFQEGGSFIVPSNVGSEGMPIRVHAGELVQIIPAEFTHRLQSIPMNIVPASIQAPQLTGATINNTSNQQTTNTSNVKEFHLHVTESPTSDVRDSFDLMETLS